MIKRIRLFLIFLIINACSFASPIVSFTVNSTNGCSPLITNFTNNTTGATSYLWDFGDGNTSTMTGPSNVYAQPGSYTVKLIAYNDTTGEKDSLVVVNLITVADNPVAEFSVNDSSSCFTKNTFAFTDQSLNASSWIWDFGDGNTSLLQHPTHTYSAPGNYTVKLITNNTYGCNSIKTKDNYIHVFPVPKAIFSTNQRAACNTNQAFVFTNASTTASSFTWNFGDGNTSTLFTPTHNYSNTGSYDVTLIAYNTYGCSDSVTYSKYITIHGNLVPVFGANQQTGCTPLPVSFSDSTPNATGWQWVFGDGGISTQKNPVYSYTQSGIYDVRLTVTTNAGCTYMATKKKFITVNKSPKVDFSTNTTQGCVPLPVNFTNKARNIVSWQWNFGDGKTSTELHPTHTYLFEGNYPVTLRAVNSFGCESVSLPVVINVNTTIPDFTASPLNGCAPQSVSFTNRSSAAVQWLWNFGDGTVSTQKDPIHIYTSPGKYNVSLAATSTLGCSDSIIKHAYVNTIDPNTNFILPPVISACKPYNTSLSDATPGAVSWLWDFGDGTSSTLQHPNHTYSSIGTYSISLTIKTASGCTQQYSPFRIVKVEDIKPGFTFTLSGCPGYTASFRDTTSGAASWYWDFGDGNTSTQQSPLHTYANPGNYIVSLTVTSNKGCRNTIVLNNSISFASCTPPPPPGTGNSSGGGGGSTVGSNTVTPSPKIKMCVPFTVSFKSTVVSSTSWLWNFGDGGTSLLKDPTHTYNNPGLYSITLVAKNAAGIADTVRYTNYVKAEGTRAYFGVTDGMDCIKNNILLTDSSINALSWKWDFGDGNTSTLQHPVHTYAGNSQNYIIKLSTADAKGCTGTFSKNLFINSDIVAWANAYAGCANQSIGFTCQTGGYVAYLWDFGDGNTSSLQNPNHTYSNGGTYSVTLKITDAAGCTYAYTLPKNILIDEPIADFNYERAGACNSLSVNFRNLSRGVSSVLFNTYKWDFGDGSVVWSANPTHTYGTAGTYSVTLYCYAGSSCLNTITKTVVAGPPAANFSFIQNERCLPVSITCTDQSLYAVSWLWDFSDGTQSNLQHPLHTFTNVPAGPISLTIKDSMGCATTITKPNITLLKATISASASNGCVPLPVIFTDRSIHAGSWLWDFGDGNTSTLQHPTHSYSSLGSYTVSLTISEPGGCSGTTYYGPITVNKPIPDFSSDVAVSCSPSLVLFKNNSSADAITWLWDFGDGSTSTLKDPSHIYNIPGAYTVKLSATNKDGCGSTITKTNYLAIRGSIAGFTVSANQNCEDVPFQFSDASLNASYWNWNFGDGNSSSAKSPVHRYQNPGRYCISLIVSDSTGCSSNIIMPNLITVSPKPKAAYTASSVKGCTPLEINFTNTSTQATSFRWNFGNTDTSTLQHPSKKYLTAGIHLVSLTAVNQFGCSDTATDTITTLLSPTANFYSSLVSGCEPLIVYFLDSSLNTNQPVYSWNFGNNVVSNKNPETVTYDQHGNYTVHLTVTNNNGCFDTITKTGYITVFDRAAPKSPNIFTATVTSDTSAYIIWESCTANDFKHYSIYRKEAQAPDFKKIGEVDNVNSTSFYDTGIEPLHNSYCYIVQTTDVCESAIEVDSINAHCTINATSRDSGNCINVEWNPYKGAKVGSYKVYRVTKGQAQPNLVAEVPSNIYSIIDSSAYCPIEYSYRVKACKLNGNAVSSNSDTTYTNHKNSILTEQKVEVKRSTVVNNTCILTEWAAPKIGAEQVAGYKISRSNDNGTFSVIAEVPVEATAYIDNNVDVNNKKYEYKIEAINSCNVTGKAGKGTSILLTADFIDNEVVLQWTAYADWDTEVDYYVIEKQIGSGQWEVVKIVDGNTLQYKE